MRDLGAAPAPLAAYILNLGMETLALRMERHCSNALTVAKMLRQHPAVSFVNYPALDGDSEYALAQKYLPKGTSGVIAFGLHGGPGGSSKIHGFPEACRDRRARSGRAYLRFAPC